MDFDVVIVASLAEAEWRRKQAADSGAPGLFGCLVTTFDAWLADLWELHGNGRAIVDGVQRQLLMHAVSEEAAGGLSQAVAPAAAECVRLGSGLAEFERLVDAARSGRAEFASDREAAFVRVMARYEDALEDHYLIEPGAAAMLLSQKGCEMFPRGARVYVPAGVALTWMQERFFDSCEGIELVRDQSAPADGIGRAPSGVEVRFGCPSGVLAQPGLIADFVEEYGEGVSVVVACKDPLDMFARLEPRLVESRCLRVQGRKPFGETDFGRAFLGCYRCLHDDAWNAAFLTDVLLSSFAGVSRARAVEIDTLLRGDRLARRDDALQALRAESEAFSQLEELASDPDADVLIGAFEQRVQADVGSSSAWRAEQLAALGVLRRAMGAARMAGVGMDACVASLLRATVPVAVSCGSEAGGGVVLVTSWSLASQLEPESFDVAIAADLTAENYSVADKDDAVATFFSDLGFTVPESALSRARREFAAMLVLPRQAVVLVRPLGDANADETYPAAVLEEFVDAYRLDPSEAGDIDNAYRLPPVLQEGLVERGEELLFANARSLSAACVQEASAEVPESRIDDLAPGDESLVMVRRRDSQGAVIEGACPSPSQIEVYLECPYRWFAERRLRLDEIDEGFGPLERGTFAHAVLQEFYQRFQASGQAKVNAGNLEVARGLMCRVADELAARQRAEEPGGRYAAVTELERREVAALCDQLVAYLDFEAQLLPTFHPKFFEYEIDADHAVDYAGHSLVGKVDRIDVDDAGHAVVIDYKGSVGAEHEIAGKGRWYAGKVQTRIYARAIERALGFKVVGALYVSYGARPTVAGAYDPRVLEAAHLPGMRHDRCACGLLEEVPAAEDAPDDYSLASLTFERMLDETEAIADEAVSAMAAGLIAPHAATADACRYCKVLACSKRGA